MKPGHRARAGRRPRWRPLGAALFALFASACYRYVPVQGPPEVGRPVRVALTAEGGSALTSTLGPGVSELDGVLVARADDDLTILLERYVTDRQGLVAGGNESIRVPLRHLTGLGEKRLDGWRSVLLGIGLAGGAVAAFELLGPEKRVLTDVEEDDPGAPAFRQRKPWVRVMIAWPVLRLR